MSEESKIRPVKLKCAWNVYSAGHVFTAMPATTADLLIQHNIAEYADGYEAPNNRAIGGKKGRGSRITKEA